MDGIKLNLNSAKIIKLISGEEICCMLPPEQLPEKSNLLRLSNPMLIKYVPHISEMGVSDYIALVKWVGFTNDDIVSIPKDKILTICNATDMFTERYQRLVKIPTNQELPQYIERDLKDDEYSTLDKNIEIKERDKNKMKQTLQDIVDTISMPSKLKH